MIAASKDEICTRAEPKIQSARAHKILCFEDNDGDYLLLREYLREAEFDPTPELRRAKTLAEGLAYLQEDEGRYPYDMILLDLSLPDSQGLDTLARVAKAYPRMPITILSGNDDRFLAVKMVQGGAQDYLLKDSLNSELLTRSILYAMERQRSQTRLSALNHQLQRTSLDLKTTQMQLAQAEKLDSLGRLAAGVAHEVKNPLATLQMGVDYFSGMTDQLGKNASIMADSMNEAIRRADNIICGMVDYSRSETLSMESHSINEIVKKSLQMVQHEILRKHLHIHLTLQEQLPPVHVDHGKIEQVLINIFMNAIQASPIARVGSEDDDIATLQIRTFTDRIHEIRRDQGVRRFEQLRANDKVVVVEVCDQGDGIPNEKMTRIFDPFYTTKATGEGTGLGLSVAKNIVDLHRGYLQIRNRTDRSGVRVRIFFKAHKQQT